MKIYVGIDLHSNNSFVAMVDGENKAVYKKDWQMIWRLY